MIKYKQYSKYLSKSSSVEHEHNDYLTINSLYSISKQGGIKFLTSWEPEISDQYFPRNRVIFDIDNIDRNSGIHRLQFHL